VMTRHDLPAPAFGAVQGPAPAAPGIARLFRVSGGLGFPPSRQRLVLNYNYEPFLGNLRPADIAARLQRTVEYVVPYDKGVLTSMNTGTPRVIHASRWQRFRRAIVQVAEDLETAAVQRSMESGDDMRPAAGGGGPPASAR